MEIEVGYAYWEGNLSRADTMSVTVPSTTKHRKRAAKALALAALERDDKINVSHVWIEFIYDQRAVECSKCGSWQVHVTEVEYASDGELVTLDDPVEILEDGNWRLPDKYNDDEGYLLVDKQWATCDQCGHRESAYAFVPDN